MRSKKVEFLRTFRIVRARVVVVAFLLLALLPARVEGFTLIELLDTLDQIIGGSCLSDSAVEWNACLTDITSCKANGFSGGIGSGGPFFTLSVEVPNALYLYTYGDENTNTKATIRIRSNDLSKLPEWRQHAIDTEQTLYVDLEGRWDLVRASGPIGGFPGNLHFEFGNGGVVCVVPVHRN